ncbi:hypothetical protein DFH06DRAFT_1122450 [Mycena polygramma]|nr:hypothetical protein DFH06DRAFT_1122450 [Mycena polygramma]
MGMAGNARATAGVNGSCFLFRIADISSQGGTPPNARRAAADVFPPRERGGFHAGHRHRCFPLKITRQCWAILASAILYVAYGLSREVHARTRSRERTIKWMNTALISCATSWNLGCGTVISGQELIRTTNAQVLKAAPKTAGGGRVSPPNVYILRELLAGFRSRFSVLTSDKR